MGQPFVHKSPIPGLGLSAGITLSMLSLMVLLPIAGLLVQGFSAGIPAFLAAVNTPRTWAALYLSFRLSLVAALRKVLNAAVDLPFALPTAVAGIALTALYAPNGAFGHIAKDWGFKIAYTQWGILIALIFVGLPFVTRTVQPVIEEIAREVEEASATLGATRAYTLRRVIWPMLAPAALTGFALSLARAVGEYGSVIFIAGNIPLKTEIAPLLIVIKLEEYNEPGAAAIGIAMLVMSFGMLFVINAAQVLSRKRRGNV